MKIKFPAAKNHGAKLFEHLNNEKKLIFHYHVVLLSRIELPGVEGDRKTVLHDDCPKLKITGIGEDMEGFVIVRMP